MGEQARFHAGVRSHRPGLARWRRGVRVRCVGAAHSTRTSMQGGVARAHDATGDGPGQVLATPAVRSRASGGSGGVRGLGGSRGGPGLAEEAQCKQVRWVALGGVRRHRVDARLGGGRARCHRPAPPWPAKDGWPERARMRARELA